MANAIESTLMPNEKLVFQSQLHWIIFAVPFIVALAVIYFIFTQKISPILNLVAIIIVIYFCASAWIRYLTTYYALTNSRTINKEGWLSARMVDLSLERIEGVELQQSILGRMFGYGDVIVTGTGGDKCIFAAMDQPQIFRQQIFAQQKILQNARY